MVENKRHRSHYKGFIVISDHNIYGPPKGNTDHPAIHMGGPLDDPRFWTLDSTERVISENPVGLHIVLLHPYP